MHDAIKFLNALAAGLPSEERLILCGFKGNPDEAEPKDWRPRPWRPGVEIPFVTSDNAYVTVSSFGRAPDNSFRRRQGTFSAGRALMVDDIGTKVHIDVVKKTPPSAIIETSSGNQQWWFFLDKPERDQLRFDAVIRAFISSKLLGADPGMAGVTRVGRLPGFTNGKPKHKGFVTRIVDWNPKRRFSVNDLLKEFNLELAGRAVPPRKPPADIAKDRVRAFFAVQRFLENRSMFKRANQDLSGWREMHCPWVEDHTNAADTGAAIREPAADNQWYGAFKCHHGSHADKHWKDLTDWVADRAEEELAIANARGRK